MSITVISSIGRPLLSFAIHHRYDLAILGSYALPRLLSKKFRSVDPGGQGWESKALCFYNWTKRSLPPDIFRFFNVTLVDNFPVASVVWLEKLASIASLVDWRVALLGLILMISTAAVLDFVRYGSALTLDKMLPNLPGHNQPKYLMLDVIAPRDYDKTRLI